MEKCHLDPLLGTLESFHRERLWPFEWPSCEKRCNAVYDKAGWALNLSVKQTNEYMIYTLARWGQSSGWISISNYYCSKKISQIICLSGLVKILISFTQLDHLDEIKLISIELKVKWIEIEIKKKWWMIRCKWNGTPL